jgi:hypothetical protein
VRANGGHQFEPLFFIMRNAILYTTVRATRSNIPPVSSAKLHLLCGVACIHFFKRTFTFLAGVISL